MVQGEVHLPKLFNGDPVYIKDTDGKMIQLNFQSYAGARLAPP